MKSLILLAAFFAQTLAAVQPRATIVDQGFSCGISDQGIEVCNDQKSWRLLWLAHNSHLLGGPKPIMPTVNFSDEVVVAIYLGEKGMGGWAVNFVSVGNSNGDTVLTYEVESPSGFVTQGFTQPYLIVTIKRPSGKLIVMEKGTSAPQLVKDFGPQTPSKKPQAPPSKKTTSPTGSSVLEAVGFIVSVVTLALIFIFMLGPNGRGSA